MRAQSLVAAGFMLAIMTGGAVLAQDADAAFGVWKDGETGSQVQMYKCGDGKLCASIVSVNGWQKHDIRNPVKALRPRLLQGLVIMQGAVRNSKLIWTGRLYNRADGGIYNGTITVKSKNTLELSGCWRYIGFLCQTQTWTRVGP